MDPCRWLVPVSLNSIGAAYATSLLLRGRPGISTRREGTRTCGRGILAVYDETKNRKSPDAG